MKACYEVEERIRRHNEVCKADCVSLVEKNLRKKGLAWVESKLCDHCRTEWRGTKKIWIFLGHSPDI